MAKNIGELIGKIAQFERITADSRRVTPGTIFVAVKGRTTDGHDYITDAIENGATAVVGEREIKDLPVDYYIVDDAREALGELAGNLFGNPSKKLKIIGVTGTKGKTTTCHIIYHILTKLGKKAGLSSSISVPGNHVTSPDVVALHKSLKEFVDKGFEYAVIEVSSHGIDQKRIAGIKFDIGVLTNIAPEHLDYHKTLKEYRRVKMSFINSCKEKVISPKDTKLDILPGKYNNLNAETAIMTCEKLGIPRSEALGALLSFELPEGRLSRIENNLGINLIVDFAHTPDSLLAVLSYLKTQTKGKLITVFGCAGERDTKKRSQMGKISADQSDISIFTSEDPRSENVVKIINKIAEGARKAGGVEGKNFFKVAERGEAIALAISLAKKDDTVAVLGKGHEKSMAWGNYEHPWSDTEAINNYLKSKDEISGIILAAGKGTRMKSSHPKVLHKICGRPMIAYTLENLRQAGIGEITAVVSFRKNEVIKEIGGAVKIAVQKNPKGGTADAARTGFEKINPASEIVLVINGDDSAFYSPETIKRIIESHKARERVLTFVSLLKEDPTGLGRVIRGENGLITNIVEEKDATPEERKIKEVNDGLYVFNKVWFAENIGKVKKSPQGELYLVDLIKIAIDQGQRMATYTLPNDNEWQGINTQEELAKAVSKMEAKLK